MNQFDVYINPIAKGRVLYPYVCCLQSELLDGLSTKVVCFVTSDPNVAFDKVSVPISIGDTEFHLCMNVMATIESHRLSDLVCNLMDSRGDIVNAYDALFMGI